ncbi:MAG: nucleotidyltransferase family protein [Cyanobacteria bacterium RYN_339]|nr:nucleotidyltransferase family protein [Cyanobacteria bacterium RYN_339]
MTETLTPPLTQVLPGFTAPERLAVLLSFASYQPAEREELDALVADPALNWVTLERLAAHNVIRPQAYRQLVATGNWSRVPVELAGEWADHAALIAERNHERLETARPLFTEAARAGIPIALLKGIYFAPTYYGDVGYKRMNDIDFLIKVADIDRTLALVHAHEYFPLGLIKQDDTNQATFSHHAPPYFHPTLRCVLGTHWGLISPRTPYKPDYAAMWERVVPFDFLGAAHHALHPVDNLHHLCIHLPHYKAGVRELADLWNLLRAHPDFDWPLFEAEVAKAGSQAPVYHALALVQALAPMPAIAACLARLKPAVKGFLAKETALRTRVPSRILYARSTHMSTLEKCFGEFTMAGDLPTKWRAWTTMWAGGLWAPREEIARFHFLAPDDWTLRLRTPSMVARTWRYGAKDFGNGFYTVIHLMLVADLCKSAVRHVRGITKPNKLEAAAFAHGLSMAQVEELKELLE